MTRRAQGGTTALSRPVRLPLLRRLLVLIVLLALVPPALILLYRSESVHPISTLMLWRHLSGQPVTRIWAPLEEIAPILRYSVLMSEDGQFCAHRGVDWAELNAVIDEAFEGERTRGASTLTMQTAKNLFLWHGRSYFRKALEIPLAIAIDGVWSKRRIMEVYLNIAEWGEGVFGIEAAARHYFGIGADSLNARQAALLATTLPDPRGRDPAQPSARHRRVADVVQRRAARSGGYVQCVK